MSIKDRVRRLEGRGDPDRCRECRLRPTKTYAIYPGEEDRLIPEPEHCPECGRLIEIVCIRVEYEEEGDRG
jgi:hypothetical protein